MTVDDFADTDMSPPPSGELAGQRVAIVGKLGSMNRRRAKQLLRQHGAILVERCALPLDIVVQGADSPNWEMDSGLDDGVKSALRRGEVVSLTETQLWERLGQSELETATAQLYTPAMLAELLNVPIGVIRRWHRRGLIVPAREIHHLPYFAFQEIATARRLAEMLAAGNSPAAIERKLALLAQQHPDVARPLAQLSVIVAGRDLLLRQGEGLIDARGQRHLDFEAYEWRGRPETAPPGPTTASRERAADVNSRETGDHVSPTRLEEGDDGEPRGDASSASLEMPTERRPTISIQEALTPRDEPLTAEGLLDEAREREEMGDLVGATALFRAALLAGGPTPIGCFQLAEVLYAQGRLEGARERYATAVELDENFVEARANLACVLVQLGELDEAEAAFQGALHSHAEYPDVHYHLARLLDRQGRAAEALPHWQRFAELAPDSPWADEAWDRLEEIS